MSLLALILAAAPLQVRVDGHPLDASDVESLAGNVAVVHVAGIPLWLEGAGPFELETVAEDGEVTVVKSGGRVVGARIDSHYRDEADLLVDPLAGLTPAQLALVRGVVVETWNPKVAATLAKLPAAKLCLAVNQHFRSGAALAKVPPVPCFALEAASTSELSDYGALKGLTALRHLALGPLQRDQEIDARWLTTNTRLESVELSGLGVRGGEALAALPALRRLTVQWVRGPLALEGTFPALERLSLAQVTLGGLAKVAAPKLWKLELRDVPVETLPPSLPALRSLTALTTRLPAAALEAFAKKHPRADLDVRWEDALKRQLKGATRVTVRSGGLCHRDPEDEQVLATLDDPKEVTFLLTTFAIDEGTSQGMCMCCGGPTLSFYAGKELLDEVSFQHGSALRWPGWPADGNLADERLVHLLAEKGVKAPLEELEEEREQEKASRAAFDAYRALLPQKVFELVRDGASNADAVAALTEGGLDAKKAGLVLALYAAHAGPMNLDFGLDEALADKVLPKLTVAQLAAAATSKDPAQLEGAARVVFRLRRLDALKAPAFAAALPLVAKAALTSPHRYDRVRALQVLGQVETRPVTLLLREVLAGTLAPPRGPEPTAPGGTAVFEPSDGEYVESVSEAVVAAYFLGRRKDAESMAKVRALAAKAEGDEAKLLGKLGLTR